MDEQAPASTQAPCAPRGPHRAGPGGAGARAAAERFGLDWATAAPSVLAVAAEACARVPEEWEIEGPGIAISLGDAADLDPGLLEAMLGPDGLGGQGLGPQFGQDHAADALRPGPVLAALTEQAVAGAATLTDDELTGALQAARRLEARAQWQQTTLVAQYARRRAGREADARARGVPKGRRPGEFPDDELACELLITRNQAAGRIEADLELTSRLPRTYAGMANGTITAARADTIAAAAGFLSDEDAARADEILAAAAPGLRVDQLGRKAAALEMKLDPEAARVRKQHAKSTRQRVEVRRELSGNATIAGRELDTATALACKANVDAIAVRLRNHARIDAALGSVKALVMTDTPNAAQLARLRELLSQLKLTPEPIARDNCDHRNAEDHYTPSRKLKHLLRARTETCDAPGCNAQAVYCDQDHTTPWPDGPTCQCNFGSEVAEGTIAASRHRAGTSSNPNPASSAGPSPAAASTPPHPPSTTSNAPAARGSRVGHPTPVARPTGDDDR